MFILNVWLGIPYPAGVCGNEMRNRLKFKRQELKSNGRKWRRVCHSWWQWEGVRKKATSTNLDKHKWYPLCIGHVGVLNQVCLVLTSEVMSPHSQLHYPSPQVLEKEDMDWRPCELPRRGRMNDQNIIQWWFLWFKLFIHSSVNC